MSKFLYQIEAKATFEAAHCLDGHPTCGQVHGHSYHAEATVSTTELVDGMVCDVGDLRRILREFDHTQIVYSDRPATAENIAAYLAQRVSDLMRDQGRPWLRIEVSIQETDSGRASVILTSEPCYG